MALEYDEAGAYDEDDTYDGTPAAVSTLTGRGRIIPRHRLDPEPEKPKKKKRRKWSKADILGLVVAGAFD